MALLQVARAERVARDIHLFELRHPGGETLPPFTAGAHVAVTAPNGSVRKYSLCNDPEERDRYVIAVKRDPAGHGGSVSLVDGVKAGDLVEISEPRNAFELDEKPASYLLIAGGIGITPILAMARRLMEAVRDMTGHWSTSAVHFESFADAMASSKPEDQPFTVRLASSGARVEVPPAVSILEAMRAAGHDAPSSCESGTCGTCKTRLLEGVADHRDLVLMDDERGDWIMICVSRALTPEIAIDR